VGKKAQAGQIKRDVVLRESRGLCQCTGECGHNHKWEPGVPAARCRAPFWGNIRRKKDHPSCWRLAPSFSGELEYAEFFGSKDIEVRPQIVMKGDLVLAFCERCAKNAGELNAVRVVPNEPS
jgi:hypothetical protein